ncbi:MAG: virulence-associated E family protein [Verrucomicrobiota bacterium]
MSKGAGVTPIRTRPIVALTDVQQKASALYHEYDLTVDDKGKPFSNADNVLKVLDNIPQFRDGGLWQDSFRNRPMTDWKCEAGQWREWKDSDDVVLLAYLQRQLCWGKLTITAVQQGLEVFLQNRQHNPLLEWLEGLEWDGTPRVEAFISDVYGTPRSTYNDSAGRCFLVGLIARAMQPGCQLDTMLILEGKQGLKKSSSLGVLGGEFYVELPRDFGGIEFLHDMEGAWLAEIPDMSGFRGRDIEHVKAFITLRNDKFRSKYGRRSANHPRHCVFAGTANSNDWLDDPTGGRRFIPIECAEIDLDYLKANRDQLFAEAVALYKRVGANVSSSERVSAGADWWVMPETETLQEQAARQQEDPWTNPIRAWLKGREIVEINEIATVCLDISIDMVDQRVSRRIASVLKKSGYENKATRTEGKLIKRWRLSVDASITVADKKQIELPVTDEGIEF